MKKHKKRILRKERGITLIALVITIIVLLILAGVSIAMLTGDNGILSQAQRAKNETEKAQANETSDLANIESLINEYQSNINIPQVTDENPGELEQEDANTLVINSIEDLVFFSNDVTKGNNYEGKTVKLGVNLDFNSDKSYVNPNSTDYEKYGYNGPLKQALTTGSGFSPIGSQDETNSFYGTFDGNNKVICSLYINMNSEENRVAGLFSSSYGEIRNLGLVNVNITAQLSCAGGITAISYNNIYNCYVTGNIKVTGSLWMQVGGICGLLNNGGSVEKCYSTANVTATNISYEGNVISGGIVGQANPGAVIIDKCYNTGSILADGGENTEVNVGGIIGFSRNEIKNCYNTGNIEGKSDLTIDVGGISGYNDESKNISYAYNTGIVKATGKALTVFVGGICGSNYACTITNVFNTGDIISEINNINNDTSSMGGLASGRYSGGIYNGYNIGNINSKDDTFEKVGSIIGLRFSMTLSNCNYLKGTYTKGIGKLYDNNDTTEGVFEKENISDFPSVLDVVNVEGAFEEDNNNVNNGYPLLKMNS